ncbi:MAG: hypothetical protein AB1513_02930 [Pseudomonadota bacterium]
MENLLRRCTLNDGFIVQVTEKSIAVHEALQSETEHPRAVPRGLRKKRAED